MLCQALCCFFLPMDYWIESALQHPLGEAVKSQRDYIMSLWLEQTPFEVLMITPLTLVPVLHSNSRQLLPPAVFLLHSAENI